MKAVQREFALPRRLVKQSASRKSSGLAQLLRSFNTFGQQTKEIVTNFSLPNGRTSTVPTFVNEFWTAKQRQGNSLHEISYRACFKPQLPHFFIEKLTTPGDVVYDPFMGRGTTLIEAALLGRIPWGNDINPLSSVMTRPRLTPPTVAELKERLEGLDLSRAGKLPEELLVFFHPETLRQIVALKRYLLQRSRAKKLDHVDEWIRLVAVNRLTGHSPGFFSVYTLPPNQAVSIKAQQKINATRKQTPPKRDIVRLILKKSLSLLTDCKQETVAELRTAAEQAIFLSTQAAKTKILPDDSVSLVVTSPPFLDVVQYADDNWLRCWFLGIDAESVKFTTPRKLEAWKEQMTEVFHELFRIVKPGGHVAFEVGEIQNGKIKLEEAVLPCGVAAGFTPELVLINDQKFTKTANCWGVKNMDKGTNTNRVVVFRK